MEELLVVIFQLIGQVIFELLAYTPFEWLWWREPLTDSRSEGESSILGFRLLTILAGGLVGWASLYFFPDVMVKFGWMRVALLVVSPLGSGLIAKTMAEIRARKDSLENPMSHFWFAFCFSIGLVFVRFTFAHRP